MRFLRSTLILVAVWCASAPAAHAQDDFDSPPPHLAVVDGAVTLDREDVSEPAAPGAPLVPGDRVRTERGRAEILFPDGSAIDLDEYTTLELQGPTLLRAASGRLLLSVAGANNPASAVQFQIDTPVASAQTDGPGEYRISILGDPSGLQTEMAVVRGSGALVTERGTMPLRAGERSMAWDNGAPSQPQFFNSARFDAFDQWAAARRDERLGSRSAQYLPQDLRMYGGQLDRYGSWNYEAPYGYVWYPTVAPDWQPYYDGYWTSVPIYGWTWIGVDVWSWPTHHYGRWGYARSRWFWIPDRRWAPAWVSWGGAPGYVSWCPLGFDNRPVFALSISVGNSWRGWTVLPRDRFGVRRNVHQFAVSPRSLPANVGFVAQSSAPVPPRYAVSRRAYGGGGVTADNRPFAIDGRRATGPQGTAVSRQPGLRDRQAVIGQPAPAGPTSAGRSPQAVRRNPQTLRPPSATGQPQTPAAETYQPRFSERSQAAPRGSPIPSTASPQNGNRPYEVHRRQASPGAPQPPAGSTNQANPSDRRVYSARPRFERTTPPQAPAQPIMPIAPRSPERPEYGRAMRRGDVPAQPAAPSQPEAARPEFSRRGNGPGYTQRPAPPTVSAPPPTPPSSAPRQEGQGGHATSRGQGGQQQSSGQQNSNGGGHSRRR